VQTVHLALKLACKRCKLIPDETAEFATITLTFGDTFSKYGADGKLEDFWCDGGEKVVVPPEYYDEAKLKLACDKTVLAITLAVGPTNVFVQSVALGEQVSFHVQYGIFYCDV
jgi:hypothetical protein